MANGGLPTDIKRALQSIAKGKQPKLAVPRKVATGAHLVREWNGRTYQVEVLKRGFRMDGREYGSLTAISKKDHGCQLVRPTLLWTERHVR